MRNYIPLKNGTPWVLNHNKWTGWNLEERNVNTAHKRLPTKKVRGVTSQWGRGELSRCRLYPWPKLNTENKGKWKSCDVRCYLTEGTNTVSVVLLPHARLTRNGMVGTIRNSKSKGSSTKCCVIYKCIKVRKAKESPRKNPRSKGDTQWA